MAYTTLSSLSPDFTFQSLLWYVVIELGKKYNANTLFILKVRRKMGVFPLGPQRPYISSSRRAWETLILNDALWTKIGLGDVLFDEIKNSLDNDARRFSIPVRKGH